MTSARPRGLWPLRRRVTVLLASVGLVLVAAVSIITYGMLQARESMMSQVEELGPAQSAVQKLMGAYNNQENGIRGYAMTGDSEFLEIYEQGRESQEEALEQLADVAATSDEIDASVEDVIEAGNRWQNNFAEPAILTLTEGEELSRSDLRNGREHFAALRSVATEADQDIRRELEVARDDLSSATQQVTAMLALVGVAIVVLSSFIWVMIQHWVLRPLDELARHLQQVADGYYAHRIEIKGPPEIEQVGRNVDAMRVRIVTDLDEVATARRTLQEQSQLLERQTDELRRSNLELEQFAYVASHDLQEPLRKVASFCQLLQRRYHGQLDERADSYIDFAVEGAKRMQKLINGLLAFSRVGRTKNFQQVDLNDALTDALRSLDAACEEADAQVTADSLPTVEGDKTLLTQVFFNLVNNAVKFRGEEPARVHIRVRRDEEEWILCCADNGIGVEPQYAERIFVIFQRLHTREKYGGTGIGLAMCKKIVEFHGGRIWLEDSDAPGTRICWSLPIETEAGQDAAGQAAGVAEGKG